MIDLLVGMVVIGMTLVAMLATERFLERIRLTSGQIEDRISTILAVRRVFTAAVEGAYRASEAQNSPASLSGSASDLFVQTVGLPLLDDLQPAQIHFRVTASDSGGQLQVNAETDGKLEAALLVPPHLFAMEFAYGDKAGTLPYQWLPDWQGHPLPPMAVRLRLTSPDLASPIDIIARPKVEILSTCPQTPRLPSCHLDR